MAQRPITPEDLWNMGRVGPPEVAPDGTFAVVPVTTYDVDENEGKTRLYRVVGDGTVSPLTSPDGDATAPAISPDGTRVAFLRKHGEPTCRWAPISRSGHPTVAS